MIYRLGFERSFTAHAYCLLNLIFIRTLLQGIQALYGRKTTQNGVNNAGQPKPRPPKGGRPTTTNGVHKEEVCRDPKVDTIFNSYDGATYAFKGSVYYKLTENAVETGYPKMISEGWPGLSGK